MPFETPAGFWSRAMALLIDFLFLAGVAVFGFLLLAVLLAAILPATVSGLAAAFFLGLGFPGLVLPLLFMLYFVVPQVLWGQTVGKLFMGLRVVGADGLPPTWGAAFLRWTGSLVSALPCALGYLWAAVDPRHRAWHDMIAATLVVEVGP